MVVILVNMDDLLITWENLAMINKVKETLYQQFKIKDSWELKYFLGIKLLRSEKGVILNQRRYILEIIYEIGLSSLKPIAIPLESNAKIIEFDRATSATRDLILKDAKS